MTRHIKWNPDNSLDAVGVEMILSHCYGYLLALEDIQGDLESVLATTTLDRDVIEVFQADLEETLESTQNTLRVLWDLPDEVWRRINDQAVLDRDDLQKSLGQMRAGKGRVLRPLKPSTD